ncbi:MAG: protein kinase [Isosphaerales bacterium]
MNRCPDRDRLELLLDNRLVDTELDELERHVEGCAACQHTLEALTGATDWGPEPRPAGLNPFAGTPSTSMTGSVGAMDENEKQPETKVRRNSPDDTDASFLFGVASEIGRYRVIRLLGHGGFGQVYLAHDNDLDRPVAIKVTSPERVAGPEAALEYLAEARALARLDHPHIVPVHDEEVKDQLAERQARAAITLVRLGRSEEVWPLLRHSPDPRLRSFIINWLNPLGADPKAIAAELDRMDRRRSPEGVGRVVWRGSLEGVGRGSPDPAQGPDRSSAWGHRRRSRIVMS